MSRYLFELATHADDAHLRRILLETPMEGDISVAFCREPSYFQAAVVDGRFRQIATARDRHTGQPVGVGSRSVSDRYVNGRPQSIGYLSGLRLLAPHRNHGLVARAYQYFKRLHADGRAPLYLTTIAEGNQTAIKILTSRRAGLPAYHSAGNFHTLAIPLAPRGTNGRPRDVDVRPAARDDLPEIVSFLETHGPRRQFFPRYEADDFFAEDGLLRGLRSDDLLLARRGGSIVGTLAGWDQHAFRQSVVQGYGRPLRWTRPLYNAWAALRRRPRLPAPGKAFRYLSAALCVVADDDAAVFDALLATLVDRVAGGPADHLLLGLHERDPLLPLARRRRAACYSTRLYFVCWEDGEPLRANLDDRVPYLELGSL